MDQMIRELTGDLIHEADHGQLDLIVHGCNCFCTMGAGIAKQIRDRWPEAYEADLKTVKGDRSKLGTCSYAKLVKTKVGSPLQIVNAYTQFNYGRNRRNVDYDAVQACMRYISGITPPDVRIGMPRIGCGLAGGDWDIVYDIIREELDVQDVTVYAPIETYRRNW